MPQNFVRCVKHVEAQNKKHRKKYNAFAVCRVSTGFYGSTQEKRR